MNKNRKGCVRILIRKALKKDSKPAVRLMYDAILDIGHTLTGEREKENVLKQMERFYLEDTNRLSYQNCFVETNEKGEAIGIVLAYHGQDAEKLDRPILKFLKEKIGENAQIDKEADETDFYLDTLSVAPEYRGRGIGTKLIQHIFYVAKEKQYPTVSLVVEKNNRNAQKLYYRLGFTKKKTIQITGQMYDYLVKNLS